MFVLSYVKLEIFIYEHCINLLENVFNLVIICNLNDVLIEILLNITFLEILYNIIECIVNLA